MLSVCVNPDCMVGGDERMDGMVIGWAVGCVFVEDRWSLCGI